MEVLLYRILSKTFFFPSLILLYTFLYTCQFLLGTMYSILDLKNKQQAYYCIMPFIVLCSSIFRALFQLRQIIIKLTFFRKEGRMDLEYKKELIQCYRN